MSGTSTAYRVTRPWPERVTVTLRPGVLAFARSPELASETRRMADYGKVLWGWITRISRVYSSAVVERTRLDVAGARNGMPRGIYGRLSRPAAQSVVGKPKSVAPLHALVLLLWLYTSLEHHPIVDSHERSSCGMAHGNFPGAFLT